MIKTMLTYCLQEINLVLMVIKVRERDVTSSMLSLAPSSTSGDKRFANEIACLGMTL
jgi:hypothetical protein